MSSDEASAEALVQEEIKQITLRIKLPACISNEEDLEVPSLLNETLADIRETLNLSAATQNLTNFNVFYQDVNLSENFDDLVPLKEILSELGVGEIEKLNLVLKEKPYNLAAIYDHLNKFREVIGLHFIDKYSSEVGVLSGVSKFGDLDLHEIKKTEPEAQENKSKETDEAKSTGEDTENSEEKKPEIVFTAEEKQQISKITDELISGNTPSLVEFGTFNNITGNIKSPIKSLTISQWSPVPSYQKLKGDLLYITLQTLENETFNVTCHFSGFFVNKSSTINFNPAIKMNENGKVHKDYLLINLVDSLSPSFSKTIQENELALSRSSKHPETYLIPSNSLMSSPWIVNPSNFVNQADASRSQLPLISNGVDGSGFVKEWNEDFQAIRELPNGTINERILREKLLIKSLNEFNKVATETAMNVIKGNLTPLNPNEPKDYHIYLRNGIFYSLGVNATGAFDSTGGNEAARYTSSKDLAAIKLLNRIDAKGIYNLVTCIVDYMGQRVICQAPVPGILDSSHEDEDEEEPADKVCYGLSTDGSKIFSDSSFENVLKPIAEAFHLKPHSVTLDNNVKSEGDLITSKDIKGVRGTDERKYIIDLYRATPLDIEFIEAHWDESKETSYPHRETVLRHEAVEEWWKRKVSVLFKAETERLEKEGKLESKDGEKPQIVLPSDQVTINTDAFTSIDENSTDKDEVREVSKFVKEHLIEEFLEENSKQISPFDGNHLTSMLHKQGINLRYLGYIAEQACLRKEARLKKIAEAKKANEEEISKRKEEAEKKAAEGGDQDQKEEEKSSSEESKEDEKEDVSNGEFEPVVANFDSLYRISVQEMVARSVKHLLRRLSADIPVYLIPTFVSHFHNCLLGSKIDSNPECIIDESLKCFYNEVELEFTKLNSSSVIELVANEVLIRFRYQLPADWISNLIRPLQLFREIAIKYGIQWKSLKYAFTKEEFEEFKVKSAVETQVAEAKSSKNKKSKKQQPQISTKAVERTTIFVSDDIVNFVPIVKDSTYKSTLVDEIFETARAQIFKGENETGINLLNNLLSVYEQIYGRVHPETSKFYGLLSQYYAELGLKNEACDIARKACILAERTTGFDSYESITAYINSAFFESANDDYINALNLYNKAINDWSLVYGDGHPSSVNTYANLAELLSEHKLFLQANKLFEKAISISIKLNGEESQICGMLRYRYGGTLLGGGDFKSALDQFKSANDIFTKFIGPDDQLSKKSSSFVTNISTYLAYNEHQKLEQKKALAQQANSSNGKVKAKSAIEQQLKSGKKGKKNDVTQPNPEIASKSVDDILQYIEGKNPKKQLKKKSNNKKSKK